MAVVDSVKNFVATYLMSRELSLVVLVAAFAGAAVEAHALDYGCRDKEQIKKELMAENQVPIVNFLIDGRERGAKNPEWIEVFYTADLKTGNGYRLQRSGGDKMCVSASTTNTKLFNNQTLDQKAYLDAPDADKKGVGINNLIYGTSINDGENPMFRVVETNPYLKATDVKYLLSNPQTGRGSLVAATLDGQWVKKHSKGIPAAGEDGAQHGARYTPAAEDMLAKSVAGVDHGAIFTPAGQEVADQQAEKPQ
ncbi:MAG TPA: hypothetical protein PL131_11175 [Methylotenera sp.]|nr:hypothetical protein [Methylotenera sp.]HPH06428.1 hypothetical protein [Methylotenera sp.]HPN00425.1 hypothetical protein [Methylotenera sp.]